MAKGRTLLTGIVVTREQISDIIFMLQTRLKPTYFTRKDAKMGFQDIILFLINLVKKSLQLELDDFFDLVKGGELYITKQAFSQARQKISHKAFEMMMDKITRWYYEVDDYKKWRGYRLLAIDGTVLELPDTEQLREAFGYAENGTVKVAKARAAGLYDLENDMMVAVALGKYRTGERDLAKELFKKRKGLGAKKDLVLFDRGYFGKLFLKYLESLGIKYVVRVTGVEHQIMAAKEPDQIIDYEYKPGRSFPVRVVRFVLDSGEEEILLTNLLDEDLSLDEFKALYFRRWGIETKYNEIKNKLEIEAFSGETVIAIKQDFYASMYLTNMAALAKQDANEQIQERNKGKVLKYDYKTNANILIGKLKDKLILMLLEDDPLERDRQFLKIMDRISRNVVPIRPGRSNPRKKGPGSKKHPRNRKRNA